MNASFARIMPKRGPIGFFSQSGALCVAVLDYAEKLGIGFSKFVSIGNKAQVGELEMLRYFLDDPETRVIAMYVEDLTHPHEIIEVIEKARREGKAKPVIALKAGRTSVGASASASHTGALAGEDVLYGALFSQAGIIRAEKVSELFDYAKVFSCNSSPKGNRLGIVTNAGGPGVLATDEASLQGLTVNALSQNTRLSLAEFLPKAANTHNPVDVVGDADAVRYEKALRIVAADPDIDMILAILTHQTMTEVEKTAQAIIRTKSESHKPIVACFMGGMSVEQGVSLLHEAEVATIEYPEEAAAAIARLPSYGEYLKRGGSEVFAFQDTNKEAVKTILSRVHESGRKALSEKEATSVFAAYGFPTLWMKFAKDRAEAEAIAAEFGKPVVMKIVSPDILHKSDAGGVRVNIEPSHVGEEYDRMMEAVRAKKPEARIEGVLLEEMISTEGLEIILGGKRDPSLGGVVMVGFGGIYVEVLKDVAFGLAPITEHDARRMVDSLKARKIFDGIRGQEPSDVEALIQMLGRLSALVSDFPEIAEIDINPLKMFKAGEGVRVLDARIILS
jgi:acetyltransferase